MDLPERVLGAKPVEGLRDGRGVGGAVGEGKALRRPGHGLDPARDQAAHRVDRLDRHDAGARGGEQPRELPGAGRDVDDGRSRPEPQPLDEEGDGGVRIAGPPPLVRRRSPGEAVRGAGVDRHGHRDSRRGRQNPGMEIPGEFDVYLHNIALGTAPEGIGESLFEDAPPPATLETGSGADPSVEFRRTLGMFATGVTVVTTRVGEVAHGMTANAFMSVSLVPPLILISVDRRARMNALLREGARYGVSVLEEHQTELSDRFAGRVRDGGNEPGFQIVRDTPLVEGALAHLVARVVRSYWGGDHSLFLGQVEFARYGEGRPLLFHGGRYERLIEDPQVFSNIPRELLDPILALGEERAYADGATIMRRGEPGAELLLVLEGTVRIERPGFVMDRGSGELIGEIEVLDPGEGRTADIHAVGAVRCLSVSRDTLLAALGADPRAAVALIEVLASRFRESA